MCKTRNAKKINLPNRVAILHKSARSSRHNAIDDLTCSGEAEELDLNTLMSWR